MRRSDRQRDEAFAKQIIDQAAYAVLALTEPDGQPYGVPVSTVRHGNCIYVHGSYEGRKMVALRTNPNVCLTFVGDVTVPPPIDPVELQRIKQAGESVGRYVSQQFTTAYASAIAFGKAVIVEDEAEKVLGLRLLSEKYTPGNMEYFHLAIAASLDVTCVIRIDLQQLTGKEKP